MFRAGLRAQDELALGAVCRSAPDSALKPAANRGGGGLEC